MATIAVVDEAVITCLQGSMGTPKPTQVIETVKKLTGAKEQEVLNSVWALIDRGLVSLTKDLRFKLVEDPQPEDVPTREVEATVKVTVTRNFIGFMAIEEIIYEAIKEGLDKYCGVHNVRVFVD